MERDVFAAGVAPGGPNTGLEVRVLICLLVSSAEKPVGFEQLYEAVSEHSMVNYFELVAAIDLLTRSGHLQCLEESGQPDSYSATELGHQTAKELRSSLPTSVRDKSLAALEQILLRERRKSEVRICQSPAIGGGWQLELTIPDGDSDLLSFSLFVPGEEQCELIKKRFLNAPHVVYQCILALLTGNRDILGDLFGAQPAHFD